MLKIFPGKFESFRNASLVTLLATQLLAVSFFSLDSKAEANEFKVSGEIALGNELSTKISQANECQENCPPVITKFYCEGQEDADICEGTYEDPGHLIVEYEDPDGDASAWVITGYTFGTGAAEEEIEPANGNGVIKASIVCYCEGSACTTESFSTMQATVIDKTGKRGTASLQTHCKPGIDDLIEGEIRERVPIPEEIPNIPLPW